MHGEQRKFTTMKRGCLILKTALAIFNLLMHRRKAHLMKMFQTWPHFSKTLIFFMLQLQIITLHLAQILQPEIFREGEIMGCQDGLSIERFVQDQHQPAGATNLMMSLKKTGPNLEPCMSVFRTLICLLVLLQKNLWRVEQLAWPRPVSWPINFNA